MLVAFALKKAYATLQRVIDVMPMAVVSQSALLCHDSILSFLKNVNNHMAYLRQTLKKLLDAKVIVKLKEPRPPRRKLITFVSLYDEDDWNYSKRHRLQLLNIRIPRLRGN